MQRNQLCVALGRLGRGRGQGVEELLLRPRQMQELPVGALPFVATASGTTPALSSGPVVGAARESRGEDDRVRLLRRHDQSLGFGCANCPKLPLHGQT